MKIQTATIRRLRDALLQSGRTDAAVVSPAYETLARAGILSDDERDVVRRIDPIVETLFLMMAADGKVTGPERDAVRGAVRGLANGALHDGTIKVMLETYEATLGREGRMKRLQGVAESLASQRADAEAAFTLAAAVALADDEVTDEEQGLVQQLAEWFQLGEARANALLDQLEEDKAE